MQKKLNNIYLMLYLRKDENISEKETKINDFQDKNHKNVYQKPKSNTKLYQREKFEG